MALTQVNFTEEEEKIIKNISKEQKLNKPNTIQKIVLEYWRLNGNTK